MKKSRLDEDILGDIGSALRSIADAPIIRNVIGSISDAFDDFDVKKVVKDIRGISAEKVPLRVALDANPSKSAFVMGSSQAGVIGENLLVALESLGFKDFNLKVFPSRSMRDLYVSIATMRNSNPEKYDEYDVIVIFPGFKDNRSVEDQIGSTVSIVELFTPARCFVVLPPPVTEIENTLAAARSGLNKGKPISKGFWFSINNGTYAAKREEFRRNLKSAVESAGATPIDPADVVSGGKLQSSGVSFPNSPDGLHPSADVAVEIAAGVAQAIEACEKPVSAESIVKTMKPEDLKKDPRIADKFSEFPALSGVLASSAGVATSGFGIRNDPFTGKKKEHQGIDIGIPVGTPVKAALSGRVINVASGSPSAGNYVEIEHDNGDVTRYLHLSSFNVQEGDEVRTGQVIGLSGGEKGAPGSGRSTGPHLHWETWEDGGYKQGKVLNPKDWLSKNTDAIQPVSFS